MRPPFKTRPFVKICGLTQREDAVFACEQGADYLGLVMSPTSPRCVNVSQAENIIEASTFADKVIVFGHDESEYMIRIMLHFADWPLKFQIPHRHMLVTIRSALRVVFPKHSIIPSVSMQHGAPEDFWEFTDRPLLVFDSAVGGSGKTFDHDQLRGVNRQYLLAGGLTPENVGEIVRRVNPAGVDVCTGVESKPGIKDHAKVAAFIKAVKG